jgi:predicted N-acetyltransferase YhbS
MRLGRTGPPGHRHQVYVHSVASTRPGAGAELMASLAGEADQKGWLLFLDAGNEELGTYYSRFGFARAGAVRMPDGTVRVRMWRQPQDEQGRS